MHSDALGRTRTTEARANGCKPLKRIGFDRKGIIPHFLPIVKGAVPPLSCISYTVSLLYILYIYIIIYIKYIRESRAKLARAGGGGEGWHIARIYPIGRKSRKCLKLRHLQSYACDNPIRPHTTAYE